ncbi:MAG: SDR family oxidoreductase, partial [Planctomycetota bacterium]
MSKSSHLLITGATGMVGSCVLARLMASKVPCAVIARDKGAVDAVSRVDQILRRFDEHDGIVRVRPKVMVGDINQPNLGLAEEDLKWVGTHVREILHSAASLNFSPAASHP